MRMKPDWFLDSEKSVMKQRFIMFRRAGVYYSEDTTTRQQHSLRTKDEGEALTLLHSKNEAHRQPVLNLHIARTYLTATDPEIAKRTWQAPMDEMTRTKTGPTLIRYKRAMQDRAFDIKTKRWNHGPTPERIPRGGPSLPQSKEQGGGVGGRNGRLVVRTDHRERSTHL